MTLTGATGGRHAEREPLLPTPATALLGKPVLVFLMASAWGGGARGHSTSVTNLENAIK